MKKGQWITKECKKCGKKFQVPIYLERIKFCSRKCYWDYLRGKPNLYLKKLWQSPKFREYHVKHAKTLRQFQKKFPNEMLEREYRSQRGKKAWRTLLARNPQAVLERIERARIARLKNLHKLSYPQERLWKIAREFSPNAQLEYKVRTRKGRKFRIIDVALPQEKIGLEYDGEYWHSKEQDELRDKELAEIGWRIYHFNKSFYPSYTSVCMVLEGQL